jgi:hypothetical protein
VSDRTDEVSPEVWVMLDVVMEALGVKRRQAYALAKQEGWRGSSRHGYLFGDVLATARRRQAEELSGRQKKPRVPGSAVSRSDTPR